MMTSPGTMSLTLQQPLNNIARLAIMALACALGGAGETMTTPLHDEAHALPSEEAIRVGAAIQHIVAHETGVADTIDPLAGSYYVEALTKQIEDAAMAEIAKIDAMGGALTAIEMRLFPARARHASSSSATAPRGGPPQAGRREPSGARRARSAQIEIFRARHSCEDDRSRGCARCARSATCAGWQPRSKRCARRRESGSNLVPPILDAVKVYATHGEICDALRDVFGMHTPGHAS